MPSDKNNKRVSVVFEKHKDAKTVPASGAWGGPSPDGNSIVTHFYVEYQTTPNSIETKIEEGKPFDPNLGDQIRRGDLTREIQTSVVMSPEQAVNIGRWLAQKGQAVLDRKKG